MTIGLLNLVEAVNGYMLDVDLLLAALGAATRCINESPIDENTALILRVVEMSDVPEADKIIAAVAINLRLKALAHMLDQQSVVATCLSGHDGIRHFRSHVMTCAASEPLVSRADYWVFDHGRFERRLLNMINPQGSA